MGHTDVRGSLRTARREVAKRRVGPLLVALEQVYELLRSEAPLEPAKRLMADFAQDFALRGAGSTDGLQIAAMQLRKAINALGSPALPRNPESAQTLIHIDELAPLLAREQPRGDANVWAADLLRLAIRARCPNGWTRPGRGAALIELCEKIADSSEVAPPDIREIIREELARAGWGDRLQQTPQLDAEHLKDIVISAITSAGRDRWSTEPLSEVIKQFMEHKYPLKDGKGRVGSKHRQDVDARLAAFLLFTGDLAVRDITRNHVKDYCSALDSLPDRFEIRFQTKNMRAAIEKNGQRKNPYSTIGPVTVDLKWLGPVNRMFDWLFSEQRIENNPVQGIRSIQDAGDAANTKRLPFKPDQISKLFAITSAEPPKTALYWLPLLMLMTGARPNELAQLRTDDLDTTFNGLPHLNLLCLIDDEDEAANADDRPNLDDHRRVKTSAARRMIPIHPMLIKAGFLQFVKARHDKSPKQLFRELHADQHGSWSGAITKRINRIIRIRLEITNPKYSAYSFRHGFIDACKNAGIVEETRMKFVGHQIEGVHGLYGNPHVLQRESELISAIKFDGIDFAKYPVW
ncbi:site-specific integrase [Tardiphaga sp. vice352]|nr:site-specific integrase [Tardiphaga sp. vice352]QDM32861.1 site-specific integrase [Tardiphaga sp. vice352]